MQQIKIFKNLENDVPALERQINAWLAESNARVISMFGNIAPQSTNSSTAGPSLSGSAFAPSDVLVVMLYEES